MFGFRGRLGHFVIPKQTFLSALFVTVVLATCFYLSRLVVSSAKASRQQRESFSDGKHSPLTYGLAFEERLPARTATSASEQVAPVLREPVVEADEKPAPDVAPFDAYEPPEPHVRFWEQLAIGGAPGFSVEMNSDRGLATGIRYAATIEAQKRPGTFRLSDVVGDLVLIEGPGPDGKIAYEKGAPEPPRIFVTFREAADGRTPGECFRVVPDAGGDPLPIAFSPRLNDQRVLKTRSAKIGAGSSMTASVDPDGKLSIDCKRSSNAPETLLQGSLVRSDPPYGFGTATYDPDFQNTDKQDLSGAFRGVAIEFADIGEGDVIYSWRYGGVGTAEWIAGARSSGSTPAGDRSRIVGGLPLPARFTPDTSSPKWMAVMQLSDELGPLFRISYGSSGEDSGVPGYFKERKTYKAKCGTLTGVGKSETASCPRECALACDASDDCAGFAWDLSDPAAGDKACASMCGTDHRCRLLGKQSLAAEGREGTKCLQQVYSKSAVPHGFRPATVVTARTRRGDSRGLPDACFSKCDSAGLFDCSSVSRSPARIPSACGAYPLTLSTDPRKFEVYRKTNDQARLTAEEIAALPDPPKGYVRSPSETRKGTLLFSAADGVASKTQCAAKCNSSPACAAFSWDASPDVDDNGTAGRDAKVCMLFPDEQDPVADREASFCGNYEPLFKYAPMPMPRGRHAGPTYEPTRSVTDEKDTTCDKEKCPHQCEMDCLRACDTDDKCFGFVVAAADPANPADGMYCRMIKDDGVRPEAPTVEAVRRGTVSYRKVLDGSAYDPLRSGGKCADICKGSSSPMCTANSKGGTRGSNQSTNEIEELEEKGKSVIQKKGGTFKELHNLFGNSPNKGTIDYEATTLHHCAAKCDEDTSCVMFTWDPFAQTSALTGRISGCRLLDAEDYDRVSYNRTLITGSRIRKNRRAVQNFEKRNWKSITTQDGDK